EGPAVRSVHDDDGLEPWVGGRRLDVLRELGCGFVGAFPAGLSFRDDVRPEQQHVELWEGRVVPETIDPSSPEWRRADLHRAANQWHASRRVTPVAVKLYKVAWVASFVLYDREELLEIGGSAFWRWLPHDHSCEDMLA